MSVAALSGYRTSRLMRTGRAFGKTPEWISPYARVSRISGLRCPVRWSGERGGALWRPHQPANANPASAWQDAGLNLAKRSCESH